MAILLVALLLGGCGDEPTPTPPPALPSPTVITATPTSAPTIAAAPLSPLSPLPTGTFAAVEQPTSPPTTAVTTPALYSYRVVNIYPHDIGAFTQGLVFEDGEFYEGTGLHGESSLRRVAVETGEVLQQYDLAPDYHGEGITVWGDRIFQLSYKEQTAFLYDKKTFAEIGRFSYPTEGWGLTHDGQRLIMSDGSDTLFFRDPETFEEIGRVQVSYLGQPVTRLNELEYIDGEVYANIWTTYQIVRIDPTSGQVVGVIDMTGLLNYAPPTQRVDVFNGIAYDPETGHLFVTGKWWPAVFEIELVQVG